jgi:DNA repair exonuclease SbcCD ATPase subunit
MISIHNRQTPQKAFAVLIGILTFLSVSQPVSAKTIARVSNVVVPLPRSSGLLPSRNATKEAELTANRLQQLQERAQNEITPRINSLQKLITRIQEMKHLSETQKSGLINQIQTQISSLQALLTKIQGDTDVATARADVQSIVKAYRIYWLFMPKVAVIASADRIIDITSDMTSTIGKLQTHLDTLSAQGQNITTPQAALADAKIKIASANPKAQNAIDLVINLVPDNGDNNILQRNINAIKNARSQIISATKDLQDVRQDFGQVIKFLRNFRPSPKPSANPTASP